MNIDGKQLEGLVEFVEKTLLPRGFDVKTNNRVYNDEGIQIAEFDVEVRGRVGSTDIAWLIECRDRPSQGPAPGAWIEQLVGRQMRFGFNKVTAVSTTGFSAGADECASRFGIELRSVEKLTPEAFADWLAVDVIWQHRQITKLEAARLMVRKEEPPETVAALQQLLANWAADTPLLVSSRDGRRVQVRDAFLWAVRAKGDLFDDVAPNGEPKRIEYHVEYPADDDHFFVEIPGGQVRIRDIVYKGELLVETTGIPLVKTSEYRKHGAGEKISQVASFAPQRMHGVTFAIEFHRLSETGETHVVMRKIGGGDA